MIEYILGLSLVFLVRTVFLFIALWIMIKIQKLDWHFPGLLASAALGSSLDMIPYVGHCLAVLALWCCLKKVTNADLFPDVTFTVSIGYALVFCMNLFVIGALMGDLRVSARHRERAPQEVETEARDDPQTEAGTLSQPTNVVATPLPAPEPAPQPGIQAATNSAGEIVKYFSVKGVIESSDKPIVTVNSGMKTYSIVPGETRTMETKGGRIAVRCDGARDHQVWLTIFGEQLALPYN